MSGKPTFQYFIIMLKNLYNHFAAVTILLLLLACSKQTAQKPIEPDEYPVVKVIRRDISIPLEYVVNIQAKQNVEIRARVEGYLEKIYVDEGQQVRKGQLLFQINDEEYAAELLRAKANIASAHAETKSALVELERARTLVERNIVAKTEMNLAEANLEIAKAKVAQAEAEGAMASIKVANALIKSPFDGTIDRIPLKIGSLISEGRLLTTLSDNSTVYAYFNVSETEFLNFFNKRKSDTLFMNNVGLILADETMYPINGKIETMESEYETGTGALGIRAAFKNPNGLIKHGSTGKVLLKQVQGNALLVPQRSTIEVQDKNYVLSVDKNNMVILKGFVPARRYGEFYVVTEGLAETDLFIYEGIQNVREGSIIKPKRVMLETLIDMETGLQNQNK